MASSLDFLSLFMCCSCSLPVDAQTTNCLVCVHSSVRLGTHVHMELTSADIPQKMHIHLVLGGRVSQRTWSSMILLGWLARELQGSSCPSLPSAGITSSNHQAWLSHRGSWGLNSGPCDYRASALLTEPFLLSTESLVSMRVFFFLSLDVEAVRSVGSQMTLLLDAAACQR